MLLHASDWHALVCVICVAPVHACIYTSHIACVNMHAHTHTHTHVHTHTCTHRHVVSTCTCQIIWLHGQ